MSGIVEGDVTSVIDRINAETVTLADPAIHAWTKDPVDNFESEVPACLVYPGEAFSSQAGDSPVCRQLVAPSVSVIVICKIEQLPVTLKEIRLAVIGWSPDENYAFFRFTHRNKPFGEPMDILASYIWWLDVYETEYLYRTT